MTEVQLDYAPSPVEFVAAWFKAWGVAFPEARAQQILSDLRVLYGWDEVKP